ncbi:MAG: DUF2220 family protein [Endomicrobium sp.]|jgi:hypothetical protein|nr:DUF2220 family protein [Endomicrobium sp.]
MITPKEIQKQCLSWWKNVLAAHIDRVNFFPKEINRIGKITAKNLMEKLPAYQNSLEILRNNSKSNKKIGYSLIETQKQFNKIGKQSIPEKIAIETLEDYLKITGKEKEYQIFAQNYKLLIGALPQLKELALSHPQKLIDYNVWQDIIEVCKYFIKNPKPNLYIRQLPIAVHTKFIENNKGILKEALDILIGGNANKDEKDFEKRFHLKYDEPLVRFRILDKNISRQYFSGIDDLSVPVSRFEKLNLPVKKVFVVENKMNVLTFPIINETIVIFGKGYTVENLKNTAWFKDIELLYWGDLDTQGFEILSQFRNYFPNTNSFLMDEATFKQFENEKGKGTSNKISTTLNLTNEEQKLYELLKLNNWRLEQEKIPLEYVVNNLLHSAYSR